MQMRNASLECCRLFRIIVILSLHYFFQVNPFLPHIWNDFVPSSSRLIYFLFLHPYTTFFYFNWNLHIVTLWMLYCLPSNQILTLFYSSLTPFHHLKSPAQITLLKLDIVLHFLWLSMFLAVHIFWGKYHQCWQSAKCRYRHIYTLLTICVPCDKHVCI